MAAGAGNLQGISRESPGKSGPGCKPFIWLVASLPRAASIADGGPVSSESATSWAHSGSGDDGRWGPQGGRWSDEVIE